jgi:hypothetical protein
MFGSAIYVNADMASIGLGSVQIRNAFEGEQRLGYAYVLFAQTGVSWRPWMFYMDALSFHLPFDQGTPLSSFQYVVTTLDTW